MASDSGETYHPCTSHYLVQVQVNSKETTKNLWLCQKTIDFRWSQSNYCLSEMMSKHWDLIKILPMTTRLLMTCGPITFFQGQHLWKCPCYPNKWVINTTLKFPSSTHTHTHTQLHFSTYYYPCQHKNMSQLAQEGSNRSLASCTLLGVLW